MRVALILASFGLAQAASINIAECPRASGFPTRAIGTNAISTCNVINAVANPNDDDDDDVTTASFTNEQSTGSSCEKTINVLRAVGDEASLRVGIRATNGPFELTNGIFGVQIRSTKPDGACNIPTGSANAVEGSSVSLSNFAVQQSVAGQNDDRGSLCVGGGTTSIGAVTNSQVTDFSGNAVCGTTPSNGPDLDGFAFVYQCPPYNLVRRDTVTQYIQLGSRDDAGLDQYALLTVNCGFVTPSTTVFQYCRRFTWCTPGDGFGVTPALTALEGTCGATDSATQTTIINQCDKGPGDGTTTTNAAGETINAFFPCATPLTDRACATTCPDRFSVSGMRQNTFTVRGHTAAQVDSVVSLVRAGSVTLVPSWATVTGSSNNCQTFTPVAGGTIPPSTAYPLTGTDATASTTASQTELDLIFDNYLDSPSFTTDSKEVVVELDSRGTASIVSDIVNVVDDALNTVGREGQVLQTTNNLVIATAICGTSVTCCEDFYQYLRCDLEFPSISSCQCNGALVCPEVTCSSSSNKSLLYLLFLLCIPFILLLLCSSIIACCLMKRRKRGWEERQLATFDPEPQPAAPPPPVNVYEECPQYGHHDGGYSGYSDVQHCDGDGYSHA